MLSKDLVLAFVIAIILTILVLRPIIKDGMEIQPDSVKYMNAAENLVQGYGITNGCIPNVKPMTHWQPGYALALAVNLLVGASRQTAPILIAELCYCLLLFLIFYYVWRYTSSLTLGIAIELLIAFHPVVLKFSRAAMSEGFSWPLLVIITMVLVELIRHPKKSTAVILGFLLGIAVLIRYAYVGLLFGAIFTFPLLVRRESYRRAILITFLYSSIAVLIVAAWFLRNFLLAGDYTGDRSLYGKSPILRTIFYTIGNWWNVFFGSDLPGFSAVLLMLVLFLSLIILAIIKYRAFFLSPERSELLDISYLVNFSMICGYLLAVIIARTLTNTSLDDRIFSPVLIFFALMIPSLVNYPVRSKAHRLRYVGLVIFIFWFGFILFSGFVKIHSLKQESKWYFDYRSSPSMQYVQQHFQPHEVLTSDPEPFWLWHTTCPERLPEKRFGSVKASTLSQNAKVILWFKRGPGLPTTNEGHRSYLVWPEDVIWDIPVRKTEFTDGVLYSLR